MIKTILYFMLIAFFYLLALRWWLRRSMRKNTIGIFHLYCSSGGGGERVLWHTIKILLDKYPKHSIYIYTHKRQDALLILLQAKRLFKIDLLTDADALERLEFIPLSLSALVEATRYPVLTLLLQNLMSIVVSFQAAYNLVPEVYMETIGFTFTLPIFKLAGCKVATYVHYPIISNDMIKNVQTSEHASFNNREIFIRNSLMRNLKLVYYKILAHLYGLAGRRADLVMVNSSWTQKHIDSLWKCQAKVVYPPCDIESFKGSALHEATKKRAATGKLNVISIAQFRPEKNHTTQIEAFDLFLNRCEQAGESRLTLYGGCRDAEDQKRVEYLRDLISRLDLNERVSVVANASFEELLAGVHQADVAIHTMANEHFGIVLPEFMAAGLIPLAHNSGGPKTDIIDNELDGFLCNNAQEFGEKLSLISGLSEDERHKMRRRAAKKSEQFSVQVFERSMTQLLAPLMVS